MASLDHPFTCPQIDRGLGRIKDHIQDYVAEMVAELSPLFADTLSSKGYIEDCVEGLYSVISDEVEGVRSINEDLRRSAEEQINDLHSRIEDLEYELKEER